MLIEGEGGVEPESLNGAQSGFCLAPTSALALVMPAFPTPY